jgi:hypothetical protein
MSIAELRNSSRKWKTWLMSPRNNPGNTVGEKRLGNRRGGKVRGLKGGGKQKNKKVNVSKLIEKTNKAARSS